MDQMENTFKTLLQNYELGFVSPSEFLFKYLDILTLAGADTVLREKMDDCLLPLANYCADILRGSYNKIQHFQK